MAGLSAEAYAEHRHHLVGVAYRLLGDVAGAEDAVQDAWLRLRDADLAEVRDVRAYLTTVVSRIALDQLTSARSRRERYVGPWLPEPVVTEPVASGLTQTGPTDPADRVTLDESVSMAMLVVLEALSPAERTAFVLHDVFGFDFDAVAAAVGRTPAACRQLASRARRHVRENRPRFTADSVEHRRAVAAFAVALAAGDVEHLVAVLDPDVVWRGDGGGVVSATRRPVTGSDRVARLALGLVAKAADGFEFREAEVNGAAGFVVLVHGAIYGVVALSVAAGRITEIDVVTNPEKLRHLVAPPPR